VTAVGRVFHLVEPGDWPAGAAAAPGATYRPPSLDSEGFVHLSFAEQVAGSANRHFAAAPALLCVELAADRLGAPLQIEDSYGSGTSYPHLYGPVLLEAVVGVLPMRRDVSGRWVDPGAGESAAASPGR
jgi:uncharacterized protein (DUF952 family)